MTSLIFVFGKVSEELIPLDYFPQAVPGSNGDWLGLHFSFHFISCCLMPFLFPNRTFT